MEYANHPAAALFPPMTPEEYEGLVQDIREHGQRDPIVLFNGAVLDGRHRYRACLDLELDPRFKEFLGGNDEAVAFVLSSNLHRRHLTPSQRAFIAAASLPLFQEAAKAAKREGQKNGGRGHKKTLDQKKSKDREPKSVARAGRAVNVSGSMVAKAKRLIETAPDLREPVINGTITISQAESISRFEPAERQEVIERIENGDAKDVKTAVVHMSEEGHCPIAISPTFEAKHDFGSKWSKVFRTLRSVINGIRQRGGIERFTAQWSEDRRRDVANEMRSLVSEITLYITFLEGGSRNAKN